VTATNPNSEGVRQFLLPYRRIGESPTGSLELLLILHDALEPGKWYRVDIRRKNLTLVVYFGGKAMNQGVPTENAVRSNAFKISDHKLESALNATE
jgi:hypothetical protein